MMISHSKARAICKDTLLFNRYGVLDCWEVQSVKRLGEKNESLFFCFSARFRGAKPPSYLFRLFRGLQRVK